MTVLATQPGNALALAPLPEVIEAALLHGDLSKLTVQERLVFYHHRCQAAGLDPRCRPFAYIKVNAGKDDFGKWSTKTILYALKECGEQLNQIHGISHVVSGITVNEKGGIIEVTCQATMRDGRTTFDMGCVEIEGLIGEKLANAKMKAVTKAKRRATLSLCGLGDMPDESELDTMDVTPLRDNGEHIPIDNGTGHGSGKYASPEQTERYMASMTAYLERRQAAWLDVWQDPDTGELPPVMPAYPNDWQADNHLLKWAKDLGYIDPASAPDTGGKAAQKGRLVAIVYSRDKEGQRAVAKELERYLTQEEERLNQMVRAKNAELFEELSEEDDSPAEPEVDEATPGSEVPF